MATTFVSKTADSEVEDINKVVVESVKVKEERNEHTLESLDSQIANLENALKNTKALRAEVAAVAAKIKLK